MPSLQTVPLLEVTRAVRAKIEKFRGRTLGEQNTKATLVEPILEALGWDVRDPDVVHREFRPKGKDKPIDYALKLLGKPRLFIEAKGLGEDLKDRKWVTQVLSYAVVAGVEWCVLTDGNELRFYNATAPVDADEKMFCSTRITEGDIAETARVLDVISRSKLEGDRLDLLWKSHFVDRRVNDVLRDTFTTVDKALVRMIHRKLPKLSPREIAASLPRLQIAFPPPLPFPKLTPSAESRPLHAAAARARSRGKGKHSGKTEHNANLPAIIRAGLLRPPMRLFRKYKGTMVEATLLENGAIEFDGKSYDSCSRAAEFAHKVVGKRMPTNGWTFWQVQSGDKRRELADFRADYLADHAARRKA